MDSGSWADECCCVNPSSATGQWDASGVVMGPGRALLDRRFDVSLGHVPYPRTKTGMSRHLGNVDLDVCRIPAVRSSGGR